MKELESLPRIYMDSFCWKFLCHRLNFERVYLILYINFRKTTLHLCHKLKSPTNPPTHEPLMPSDSSASLPPLDWLISGMAAKIYKLLPPIHLSPSPTASNNQQFAPEASKLQQSSEVPSIVKKKKLRRLRRKNVPKNVPEKMLAENQLKSIEVSLSLFQWRIHLFLTSL
jgi:hypothetical protein